LNLKGILLLYGLRCQEALNLKGISLLDSLHWKGVPLTSCCRGAGYLNGIPLLDSLRWKGAPLIHCSVDCGCSTECTPTMPAEMGIVGQLCPARWAIWQESSSV